MLFKRCLASLLSLLLALNPVLTAGAGQRINPIAKPDQFTVDKLDEYIDALIVLGDQIDRSHFDLEAVLEQLDFESTSIVDFVKTKIYFEQYSGLLRGAQGTLMSRSGNSLDQSVLLATLLNQSGFDARILRGQLSSKEAHHLLKEMAREREPRRPIGDEAGIESGFRKIGWLSSRSSPVDSAMRKLSKGIVDSTQSALFQGARQHADDLLARLTDANLALTANGPGDRLAEEARGYFWVEFRESPSAAWESVHPVLSGSAKAFTPEPLEILNKQIPPELQFSIGIEVLLEVATGGELVEKTLIRPKFLPTANLVTQPLTFSNIPDSLFNKGAGSVLDVERAIQEGAYIAPIVEGTDQQGMMFDLFGNIIDPIAAGSPGVDLFSTVNKAFRSMISSIGNRNDLPIATSQILKIHIRAPGGLESVVTRRSYDLIGGSAREANTTLSDLKPPTFADARPLFQSQSLMVNVGEMPLAFALAQGVERLLEVAKTMRAIFASNNANNVTDLPSPHWAGHPALFNLFSLASELSQDHRIYRPGPALVIRASGLAKHSGAIELIDILTNPVRAVDFSNDVPRLDPVMALRTGVWETFAETVGVPPSSNTQNTMTAFSQADERKARIVVVREIPTLETLHLQDGHPSDGGKRHTGGFRTHYSRGRSVGGSQDGLVAG